MKLGRLGIATFLLSVAMAFTGVSEVHAGEQLGQTDFESGAGLPWHICESGPGEMDFEITGGKYQITIVNPGGSSRGGEDRWDCQFRHRGLKIVSGHQYRVRYQITASNSGKYYTKIGNLEGTTEVWHNMSTGQWDLDSNWDPIQIGANQTKTVDITFTAGQTVEVAEWAFHLGGSGQYTNGDCFPVGTVITFDNMSLIDLTSDENDYVPEKDWESAGILTNQVGYFVGLDKKATMIESSEDTVEFYLYDENGKVVYTGESEYFGYDEDSGETVHILDFSEFDEEGNYQIASESGAMSRTITVGAGSSYAALVRDSLNYFYQNRSGIDIEKEYITSGDADALKRAAGHRTDNATITQTWGYSGSSGSQDVTGGWYDAGDHGKYVVNGGISLYILQNQYEMAKALGNEDIYADGSLAIPENNNGYPDLLDEARYELEWMFSMLVKSGSYENMVYHKVHDEKWTALALAPADDPQARLLYPPTTAATLNVSATAAQAARLWKGIDDSFAEECLQVAKKTYEAAKEHPSMYAPYEEAEGGGAYGDDHVEDEFYWAACELYITTGDEGYYDDLKSSEYFARMGTVLSDGEDVDTYGTFDWGNVSALGTFSLCINSDCVEADMDSIRSAIISTADEYLKKEGEQGFGLPYAQSTISATDNEKGYVWGSNSFVLDNTMVIAYAYYLSEDVKYLSGMLGGMDYILGRNPLDNSYVTGYGTHTSIYPHHRWWSKLVDDSFPLAPNGVLCGGPNSGMEDPWVQGLGWKKGEKAPQKCYVDHIEAWSANECTINWNAPLAWNVAFLAMNTDKSSLSDMLSAEYISPIKDDGSGEEASKEATDGTGTEKEDASKEETTKKNNSNNKNETSAGDKVTKTDDNNSSSSDGKEATASKDEKVSSSTNEKDHSMIIVYIVAILAILAFLVTTEIIVYKLVINKNSNKNSSGADTEKKE